MIGAQIIDIIPTGIRSDVRGFESEPAQVIRAMVSGVNRMTPVDSIWRTGRTNPEMFRSNYDEQSANIAAMRAEAGGSFSSKPPSRSTLAGEAVTRQRWFS